jgi:hypothetical protein
MTNEQNATDGGQQGAPEDAKAKFREALAKKNQRNAGPHEDHFGGQAKAQGTHGAAGGPKDFRRKTG